MARIATIEEILAASETEVALPGLSVADGEPRALRVRKISRAEFRLCLPPQPPGSESWAPEDWPAKEAIWVETLSPEALAARREIMADLNARVVSMVSVDPVLTLEQARRLGEDTLLVAAEVLRFSGITPPEKPAGAVPEPTT